MKDVISVRVAKQIEKWQMKTIYAIGNEQGIVDKYEPCDQLHEILYFVTGKEHVSDLTYNEANKMIDELKKDTKTKETYEKVPGTNGMISKGQESKIWAMMYEIKKHDTSEYKDTPLEKRLEGFLKKYAGVDKLKFLTHTNANNVIEGLKSIVESEKRKAGKEAI